MEPTSTPKHAASLGERLNQKMQTDAEVLSDEMRKQLDKLAHDSSLRLKQSVDTAINDIQTNLGNIVKLSGKAWVLSLLTSTVLTLGVLLGLGFFAAWKLHEVRSLETREAQIKADLKRLPPDVGTYQSKSGNWYLIAKHLGPVENGATLDNKPAQAVEVLR